MATRRNIDLYKALGLDERAIKLRSKRIAAALWSRWAGLASGLPVRYRKPYRGGMRMKVKGSHVTFELVGGTFVRSIEYGYGAGGVGTTGRYDMRRTLLKSTKARTGKNGRYLNVPMGMTTRKMRSMPGGENAYRMARQLVATVRSGRGRMLGGKLPRGLTPKLLPQGRRVAGIGYQPPHATDPTHGMRRYKATRGSMKSTYGTFRTISERGKPWVHPGIKASRLMRKVARMVPAVVREVG